MSSTLNYCDQYFEQLNSKLSVYNFSAQSNIDGRTYYLNHENKKSSWLPPMQLWSQLDINQLPYGWEIAIDDQNKPYYINHPNKTTTYENPKQESNFRSLPEPRKIELNRDSVYGFGFVAGSEKPVIVRSVKEAGPAKNKLLPGDQILSINGQDVQKSPQDFVIQLVKSCEETLNLIVCQPRLCNVIRKSALLSSAKKAQLKDRPCRVRFSENLSVNDTSPLYSRDGTDENVNLQNLPNILKVYLENGQTKTFKYDPHTTVKDVVDSLVEKLSIKSKKHFALCIEYVKTMKSNKLTVLDPEETIANIASRPGAHNLRCVFRFSYLPLDFDFLNIYRDDLAAFNYLYNQSAADLLCDQLYAHASGEIALRLVALRIQQLFLMSNSNISNQSQISKTSNEINFKDSTNNKNTNQSLVIKNNKDSVNSKIIKSSTDFFSGMMSLTNSNITNSFLDSNSSKNNKSDTFSITAEQAFNNAKKCVKQIERAYGLEAFVPLVIIRSMKKKELIKMLVHFFKMNQSQLIPLIAQQFAKVSNCDLNFSQNNKTQESVANENDNNSKLINLTSFNKKSIDLKKTQLNEDLIKLCFLNLLSELQTFGTKIFPLKEARLSYQKIEDNSIIDRDNNNQQKSLNAHFNESLESSIWLSPKSGICHVTKNLLGQLNPLSLAKINQIDSIFVTRFEDCYLDIELVFKSFICSDEQANSIHIVMEEKDAKEFLVCLNSFYTLYCEYKKELPLSWNVTNSWWTDPAPTYLGEHKVKPSYWSYSIDLNSIEENLKFINLSIPPPKYSESILEKSVDFNLKNSFLDSNENTINFKANTFNDFSKNLNYEEKNSNIDNEQSSNCEFNLKENNMPSKFIFPQNNSNYFDDTFLLTSKKDEIKNNNSLKIYEDKNIDDTQLILNHQSIFKYNNKEIDNFNNESYEFLDTQLNKNYLQNSLSDSDPVSINTTETLTDIPMPGQLKATDSLLLLTQIENEIIGENGLISDHFSICDSDTDSNETSTINDNYSNENNLNQNESNSLIIEVNKKDFLKKNLAIMNDFNRMNNCDELIESNPNILVSNKENYVNALKNLKKFGSSFGLHSQISSEEENYVDNVYYNYLEENDCSSSKNIKNQFNDNLNEIVDIIDLTVLSPPSTPENELNLKHFGYENNLSEKIFTSYDNIHTQNTNSHQSSLNTKNIDEFITSVSIPAPPTSNLNNHKVSSNENFFDDSFINKNFNNETLKNEDLDLIIIPPPPNIETNFVQEQDEILNRFKKATEDMKKICEKIDLCSINPKYNTYTSSNSYINRDLHSSSSGDSGYESVFINTNSQKKFIQSNSQLNNFDDKNLSQKLIESHSFDNIFSMNKLQNKIDQKVTTTINVKDVAENSIFNRKNSCNNFEKVSKAEPEINSSVQSLSYINVTPKAPPRNKNLFSSNLQINNFNDTNFENEKTINNYVNLKEKNIFVESKNSINDLIESLEKFSEQEIKFESIGKNLEYNNSKETLISKSRQFVTCSKLFVKSASEGCSIQILSYLKECISLLKIIFINSQIVSISNFDLRKNFFSKLKDVATIFLLTVETVYKINQYIEEKSSKNNKIENFVNEEAASSPYMSDLMKHATSLASSLSSLMKHLKKLD